MAPLPPPLQSYIVAVTPALRLLLLGAVWSAALVPLLVVLFFFSTPAIRRKPIFIMNVFTVSMGIIIGIINTKLYVTQILNPGEEVQLKTLVAYIGMILLMPVIMDCILAYRLLAVYPRRTTSNLLLVIIFAPIVLFKAARLANLIVFLVTFSKDILQGSHGPSAIPDFQRLWDHAPLYGRMDLSGH
ncbi:hypothetical protein K435DRAFT_690252 [Dendrothele bispora CBS 962.96]|uniref:Uncharacterized protein n=1 Tax=Dendrothele bispora (strain CBS 962.96) TaxID=1314807 RepID=A0A4S8L3J1_DENBC|nr:hypothetical protein K435DRAFT_690252 [Dendrothele bispora CBS 962.96]